MDKRDKRQQKEKFIDVANLIECDESEDHFDETLKKVARHKPTVGMDKFNQEIQIVASDTIKDEKS